MSLWSITPPNAAVSQTDWKPCGSIPNRPLPTPSESPIDPTFKPSMSTAPSHRPASIALTRTRAATKLISRSTTSWADS